MGVNPELVYGEDNNVIARIYRKQATQISRAVSLARCVMCGVDEKTHRGPLFRNGTVCFDCAPLTAGMTQKQLDTISRTMRIFGYFPGMEEAAKAPEDTTVSVDKLQDLIHRQLVDAVYHKKTFVCEEDRARFIVEGIRKELKPNG